MSRNQFGGDCYRCGKWCTPGEGHFERLGPKWRVQHAACAIEFRGTPDPAREAHSQRRDEWLAKQTGKRGNRARRRLKDRELTSPEPPNDPSPTPRKANQ